MSTKQTQEQIEYGHHFYTKHILRMKKLIVHLLGDKLQFRCCDHEGSDVNAMLLKNRASLRCRRNCNN